MDDTLDPKLRYILPQEHIFWPTPEHPAADLLGKLLSMAGHLQGLAGAGQHSLGSLFWLSALEGPVLYHYGGR